MSKSYESNVWWVPRSLLHVCIQSESLSVNVMMPLINPIMNCPFDFHLIRCEKKNQMSPISKYQNTFCFMFVLSGFSKSFSSNCFFYSFTGTSRIEAQVVLHMSAKPQSHTVYSMVMVNGHCEWLDLGLTPRTVLYLSSGLTVSLWRWHCTNFLNTNFRNRTILLFYFCSLL